MKVARTEVQSETRILVRAASQISGSFKIVSYHSVVKDPSGTVGNRCELNEKITLATIGMKMKPKTRTT